MGRAPCCEKGTVKRGPWSPEEDTALKTFLHKHGTAGNWIALPRKAGLNRCGKSCRLRWLNYLRPDIKHGGFTDEEDTLISTLYNNIGSRWSIIASQLPGRTDNDVKNYWNTKLKKKLSLIPKIEAPKPLSYFDLNAINNNNNNNNHIINSITPVELSEFGSSSAGFSSSSMNVLEASTDPLSSSSSMVDYNHDLASWNVNYSDGVFNYGNNNNGIFMEYMGIMGFDSSSDFVLSGFGF